MAQIASAVGDGAANLPADVRAVQMLLNRFEGPSARLLEVDGSLGPLTLGAIRNFLAVRMPAEPAVIQPDSPALAALNGGDTDRIAWGGTVDAAFKAKVMQVALALEVGVDFLMAAMAFESGETFSPSIRNAAGSGATGLIQFMPATAKALGTSTGKLAAMSATDQLDFVHIYFRPRTRQLHSLEDVYMAILFPAAIGKGADFVLFRRGTAAYSQNRGLDADHDGRITVGEATAKVRQKYTKGLTEGLLA